MITLYTLFPSLPPPSDLQFQTTPVNKVQDAKVCSPGVAARRSSYQSLNAWAKAPDDKPQDSDILHKTFLWGLRSCRKLLIVIRL